MNIFIACLVTAGAALLALLLRAIFVANKDEYYGEDGIAYITGTVRVGDCLDQGWLNLKANFLPYLLVVIILSILMSMGNIDYDDDKKQAMRYFFGIGGGVLGGMFAVILNVFIRPVLEYGANLIFVRGNRGEPVDVEDLIHGFRNKEEYVAIILSSLLVFALVAMGFLALILPGFYVYSRLVLASYLVVDKDMAPVAAVEASWALTKKYWPVSLALMLLSIPMFFIGLALLVLGVFPAVIWIKAMFASFYQQVLDAHDEEFLLSLDIEP